MPAVTVAGSEVGNAAGVWGPPSSTMNWCEEDYVVTPWIAEFWNTISNLTFIILCLSGAGVFRRGFSGHSLQWELLASLGGLLLVGFGSAAFHGTLWWEAQLLDELPMILASSFFISCLIHTAWHRRAGYAVPIVLALYTGGVTAVYMETRNFDFFFVSYGVQVAVIAGVSVYHCFASPTREQRVQLTRLLVISSGLYFGGFALWNIDNNFCPAVRRVRGGLPAPLRPLLQLHAWWHVLSAFGTYTSIVLAAFARAAGDGLEPEVKTTAAGIMYVHVAPERKVQ